MVRERSTSHSGSVPSGASTRKSTASNPATGGLCGCTTVPPSPVPPPAANGAVAGDTAAAADADAPPSPRSRRTLGVPALVALLYFTVCGGPIGSEPIFSAYGPLVGLAGLVAWPLIYCVPVALCTAEMSAAFPRSGGFLHWVLVAFGPTAAFVEGFVSWGSGVADNALYPVMFHDILVQAGFLAAAQAGGGPLGEALAHYAVKAAFAVALTAVVCRGVRLVGRSMVAINVLALLPFAGFTVAAFAARGPATAFDWTRLAQRPRAPAVTAARTGTFISTLFWNFAGIDHLPVAVLRNT